MLAVVGHTLRCLQEVHIDKDFDSIYILVLLDRDEYDREPFVVPRRRKASKRWNPDGAETHVFTDARSCHRVCYFAMLDVAY